MHLAQSEYRQYQALKRQEALIAEEEEAGRREDERQAAKQQVCGCEGASCACYVNLLKESIRWGITMGLLNAFIHM